ncbi:MAG: acetolactate synthase large subunit, partial [Microbacteriaceae bacterium]|nr:acetolactate synthase large subunit [Microbacteriaceae bacterium]
MSTPISPPTPSSLRAVPRPVPVGDHPTREPEPEVISGAEAVVRTLELLGVTDVFGLPGGAILPVYDPLLDT